MTTINTTSRPPVAVLQTEILENAPIARDTWHVRFRAPELACTARPGQFFMVRLADCNDPLIGRALALYDMRRDRDGKPSEIGLVYVVKGKFTQALARRGRGDKLDVWGPLGNPFATHPTDHLILVAGGVGITPMLTLASSALGREVYGTPTAPSGFAKQVTLCYGARTQEYLAGLDAFRQCGVGIEIATEDGSMGRAGRVTDVLEPLLQSDSNRAPDSQRVRVACCGPEPMMQAVSELAERHGVACEVSLETPMACGIGICFTCVARIRQPDGSWDYRRTCVEGPIFRAEQIAW